MSHSLGQIGYFQLSNLVRNKVPFTLLVLGFEPSVGASPADLQKLMAVAVTAATAGALVKVSELGLKFDHPIVVLCERGDESLQISKQLESKGFLNIYHVKGGWQNVLLEAGVS
jgi:rhodanese-related sulfurtransferase